jgi:hypothetical protein
MTIHRTFLNVHVGVLDPRLHADARLGEQCLTSLFTSVPEIAPDVIGNYEPIRVSYEQECRRLNLWWKCPFLWRRKSPRVLGGMWMDDGRSHTSALIDVRGRASNGDLGIRTIRTIARSWLPDFGYVHASGPADLDLSSVPPNSTRWRRTNPYAQGIATQSIKHGLPGFCWAMLFGPPYVEIFGRERLRSVPAQVVEELRPDLFLIQLTATLDTYERDREAIIQASEQAMTHLGRDAFVGEAGERARLVPQFAYGRP